MVALRLGGGPPPCLWYIPLKSTIFYVALIPPPLSLSIVYRIFLSFSISISPSFHFLSFFLFPFYQNSSITCVFFQTYHQIPLQKKQQCLQCLLWIKFWFWFYLSKLANWSIYYLGGRKNIQKNRTWLAVCRFGKQSFHVVCLCVWMCVI